MELCVTGETQILADIEAQDRANQETQNLASLQMYHGGGEYVALWIFLKLVVVLHLMCGCAGDFVPCFPLCRVCFCAALFVFVETIILFQAVFLL